MADETITSTDDGKTPASTGKGQDDRRFTQADIDRIIMKRAEREAQKLLEDALPNAITEWLAAKGLDEKMLDELPKKAEAQNRAFQAKITKVENERDGYQKAYNDLLGAMKSEKIQNAIMSHAATKTSDMEALLALARPAFDLDENGNIIARKKDGSVLEIAKYIEWLLNEHPSLALPTGVPGAGSRPSGEATMASGDYTKLKFDSPEARKIRLKAIAEGWPK